MLRADALQAIYPEVQDQIVVTIMGAVAAELYTLGHRSNFFYLEHAMGLASSMGLGIALAMPRHKVVVIDGDGSLLYEPRHAEHNGTLSARQPGAYRF
jgi:sulfopyruvate decarboxylase subunit beta